MNLESISGIEALERMRRLKKAQGASFTLVHLTCNLKTKECGQLRKVERCRLRAALHEDDYQVDGDHYLPYEDLDTELPRQCFKKLIRFVAFPPNYELLKVNWFDE